MREEAQQQQDTCVYCGKPITKLPCKGIPDGRHAHIECYLDHAEDEEAEPTC